MNTEYIAFRKQAQKMYIKYNKDVLKLYKLIYTEEEKIKYGSLLHKSIKEYLVNIYGDKYDEFIFKYNSERKKKGLSLFLKQ